MKGQIAEPGTLLLRQTLVISLANLAGTAFGLVLDAVILAALGFGIETDAYFVALTVPLAILNPLSLQTTNVLQPLFIQTREVEGPGEAWRFLNTVLSFAVVSLLALALIGVFLSRGLVAVLAPGYDHPTTDLAARLCGILFLVLPVMFQVTTLGSILNAFGSFLVPASLRVIENAVKVAGVLLFARWAGIVALAWAYFVASIVELVLVYGMLRNKGFRFRPSFDFLSPKMKKLGGTMLYPVLGHAAVSGMELLQTFFSSFLSAGSLSALKYASRITDSVSGVVVRGVVTVTLPGITRKLARDDREGMKGDVREAVKVLLLITLPVALWLLIENKQLIALLFERGQFTGESGLLLGRVLSFMIPCIILTRLISLGEAAFFAISETKPPFANMLAVAVSYLAASSLLVSSSGVFGLAVGRSVAYLVGVVLIFHLFSRRFGATDMAGFWPYMAKLTVALAVMVAFVWIGNNITCSLSDTSPAAKALAFAAPTVLGAAAYLVAASAFGLVSIRALLRRKSG